MVSRLLVAHQKSMIVAVIGILVCTGMMVLQMMAPHHHIDVGVFATRSLTHTLRAAELTQTSTVTDTTFRWSYQGSAIYVPHTFTNAIIDIKTMTRAESPPRQISAHTDQLTIPIDAAAGFRTYRVLVHQITPITFDCDTQHITDAQLARLCVAVMAVDVHQSHLSLVHWSSVAWFAGLVLVLWLCICIAIPAQRADYRLMAVVPLLCLIWQFGVTLEPYVLNVTIMLACTALLLWLIQRVQTPWLLIALQFFVVSIFLKSIGLLMPGFVGSDTIFHIHRFSDLFTSGYYLYASGGGDTEQNTRTYPYPPAGYLHMAPFLLTVMQWVEYQPFAQTLNRALPQSTGFFGIVIDSSTILLLGWLLSRLHWSPRAIGWMCVCYLMLPASYIMHWQGSFAQNTGQWYALAAMIIVVVSTHQVRWLALLLSVTSHFGVVITQGFTYAVAMLWPSLRRQALTWWLTFAAVAVVYYSQYMTLFVTQLSVVASERSVSTMASRWWDFAWHQGIYGHYVGIGLALCILGLMLAPRDTWWPMAISMTIASALLMLVHIALDQFLTRYTIALLPVVAVYGGYTLLRLQKTVAARILVGTLVSYMLWFSMTLWFDGAWLGVKMPLLW